LKTLRGRLLSLYFADAIVQQSPWQHSASSAALRYAQPALKLATNDADVCIVSGADIEPPKP
jgi:hypothetical protein